jgi:hypothetical protein
VIRFLVSNELQAAVAAVAAAAAVTKLYTQL